MPKKNIELLKRLRTRFLRMRHPKHFDMEAVAKVTECGTAMCIAGHALDLEGYKTRITSYEGRRYIRGWLSPNGRDVQDPIATAQRLLGLTLVEAQGDEDNKAVGLFYRFDLRTPKEAAKVIDKIIQAASEQKG